MKLGCLSVSILFLAAACSDAPVGQKPMPTNPGPDTYVGIDTKVTQDSGGDVTQQCEPGNKFCNGNSLLTCKTDGSGYETTECPKACDNGECVDGCAPNTQTCKNNDLLEVCNETGAATVQFCENGCKDGDCVVQSLCEANAIFCEPGGAQLLKCSEDGSNAFNFKDCPHGCDDVAAECKEPVCDEGQTQCAEDEPNVVEICLPDQSGWKKATTPCKDKCVDGECIVLACEKGEKQCGPLGVEQCKEDETAFDLIEPCKIECMVSAQGDPACTKCIEGALKCDWLTVKKCADPISGWENVKECTQIQSCVEGACTETVYLKSQNTNEQNYLLLTKAFVDCWVAGQSGACRGINASEITSDIKPQDISNWFCDKGSESDFATEDEYSAALDMMGCGWTNVEDLDFITGQITAGLNAQECIGFSGAFGLGNKNSKELLVDLCTNF